MPHRMETVLVAEAPGQSVDWDLARDLLQNPAARIIACDPIAFQGALRINENVVTTKAFLTPTDVAETDRQVGKQLDGCRGVDIIEQRTGLQLTFLAVRTLALQLVAFEKAMALAAKLVASSDRFVLIGDTRPRKAAAYPCEAQDLFDIVATWSRSEGIPCDRGERGAELVSEDRWNPELGPMLASVGERLMRLRPRRVLAVRLYEDLRPRLSRHLPGVSVLPLILPNNPSRADIRAASDVASSWSSRLGLEHSEEIPSPVQALAVDRLREALSLELPLVFARSRSARNALKRFKPHVVLQMEDISPWGRSLAALARTAPAWTVVVQHGLTGEGLYGSHVMPAVAHRHACWGESSMRWNLDHGAPPDSQIIVGNPMLDEHFRGNPPITVASEMPREVAFISQPFVPLAPAESDFDRWEAMRALLPLDEQNVPIAIRPHPSEDPSRLRRLVDAVGFSTVQWDETLTATLRRPAVIVCKSSTAALEAMTRHRPVVLAAFSGRGDPTGLSHEGAALVAASAGELTTAVQACLRDRNVLEALSAARERLLTQYLDGMDGRASLRLADHLQGHLPRKTR